MEALTINEAATTTGWSPRMLRYVEQAGLVAPARSASGYRLYGAGQLQRLRTLKELLARFEHRPVRRRLRRADGQRRRLCARRSRRGWSPRPGGPSDVEAEDWLRFEQDKHQRLLAAV